MLVLLDLSTAFDTVDHNILIQRLENWVKLSGMVHIWFRSYLEGRGYYASIREHKSQWTSMTCGVPHGSILGPLLFSLFLLPLSEIMRKNQIAYHSYADDTQIYLALSPNDYSSIDSLCQCIDEINGLTEINISVSLLTAINVNVWLYQCMSGNQSMYVSMYYKQSIYFSLSFFLLRKLFLLYFFSGQINHLYDV